VLVKPLLVRKCDYNGCILICVSQEKNFTFLCLIMNMCVGTEIFRRYVNKFYNFVGRGYASLVDWFPQF
jgi:hypothetical protein